MSSILTYVKLCPECEGKTAVIDSRENPNGSIWRRRECKNCGWRYSTVEIEECISDFTELREKIAKLESQNARYKRIINQIRQIKTNFKELEEQ